MRLLSLPLAAVLVEQVEDELEGNVLLEPAAPMFHQLIFGNFSLKNVVWLIGDTCCP